VGGVLGSEWDVVWRLGLALVLCSAIGLEREARQKSAGLRTHTLVGLGAALFTLVSAYGFADVIEPGHVVLDPSRVAAQVVSGIGFIGGGLIFVRRDAVRGLTTAAGVWLTAAVGMAAGADLPLLATVTTAGYFLVVFAFPALARRLPASRYAPSALRLTYLDGRGILREALARCTGAGFAVADLSVKRLDRDGGEDPRAVAVRLELHGKGSLAALATELGELDGVLAVSGEDFNEPAD
jgi:putative Mg2+ transporter-C (MgtC) family protein